MADEQIVGSRRAGLMCLPLGSIRWSDVATGTGMDQREAVQDVLEDEGVTVAPLAESAGSTLRIRGSVTTADFRLCARRWALGDAKALSGDAQLSMEWRIEGRADPSAKHLSAVSVHIDPKHAASTGAIYRLLLKAAAQDLATWLAHPDAGKAPVRSKDRTGA